MGQDLYYLTGYLILQPVTWLPRELIAPALVYQHLAKLLIAGLFFFRFLQLRGLPWPASLLGSLLLSGSGYMCMGSCWYTLADEVVCFAALLLATEKAVKLRNWAVLTLAVALVGMLRPFHLYLCALFLLVYVPARLYAHAGWQPRPIFRTSLRLAGAAFLGVGLGAIFTLPHLYALLNSPRGSGTTSFVATLSSFPVFGLESPLHYITAALRPFANDALGTGDEFQGLAKLSRSSHHLLRPALSVRPSSGIYRSATTSPDNLRSVRGGHRYPDCLPLVSISFLGLSRRLLPHLFVVFDPWGNHPEYDRFLALHPGPRSESLGARRDSSRLAGNSLPADRGTAEPV